MARIIKKCLKLDKIKTTFKVNIYTNIITVIDLNVTDLNFKELFHTVQLCHKYFGQYHCIFLTDFHNIVK